MCASRENDMFGQALVYQTVFAFYRKSRTTIRRSGRTEQLYMGEYLRSGLAIISGVTTLWYYCVLRYKVIRYDTR